MFSLPPMSLTSGIRYEKFAQAFENFKGYYAQTPDEICAALNQALSETKTPSIINIEISPSADRKAQVSFTKDKKLNFYFNSHILKGISMVNQIKIIKNDISVFKIE